MNKTGYTSLLFCLCWGITAAKKVEKFEEPVQTKRHLAGEG